MTANVVRMRTRVLDSNADIDHLFVLRREQASLVRFDSLESHQGGSR